MVIPLHKIGDGINAQCRIILRRGDQGGGEYITVQGIDDEGETEDDKASFALETPEQVDELAAIIKGMMG
jgi:hypothetical protein